MNNMETAKKELIKITGTRHEETAWKRYIYFEYKGNQCELTLYWDEFTGYEIYWREPNKKPDWVLDWNEDEHNGMTLEHYLDELTYDEQEAR